MDNVSHTLTGLALAQSGLRRLSPLGTAILLVSANAPDSDIVSLMQGQLRYLQIHRGYTHSVLFLPVMALVTVLVVAACARRKLPWLQAWALACLGVASHLLLDWTNSYGIRLMLPFSSRWFHLDLNGLYDGFFLAVLLISALWPLLANLVGSEIGDRSSTGNGVAIAALSLISLFECGRAVLHARATASLQSRMYGEQQAIAVAALPDAFNPFRWQGVVEVENAFLLVPISPTGEPELQEVQTFYKPAQSAAWIALKQQESFRFFSYFARFPAWSLVPFTLNNGQGTRADATDLRFGVPGGGSFHCIALLDARAHVLQSYFTWTYK